MANFPSASWTATAMTRVLSPVVTSLGDPEASHLPQTGGIARPAPKRTACDSRWRPDEVLGGGGELPEMVWWRWLILSILAWVAADVVLVVLIGWRSPRLRREEGQTMAEYAVALAVIAVLAIAAFTVVSGGITQALDKLTSLLP